LDPEKIITDLKRQDIEILTEERLTKLIVSGSDKVAYIGYEPNSSLHIGNLAATIPLLTLSRHGFKAIALLADLHAYVNDKGDITEIRSWATANAKLLEKFANRTRAGKLDFRFGTDFEDQAYFIQMLRLSKMINLTQAEKSMDEISKKSVSRMTSSVIYPLMQVLDIGVLGVNVAIGSIDQRKVHVLAIENLKKLGYQTPVAIHNKVIILGTDGTQKMSKSIGNTISLDETQESLEKKIKKTFCAPGDIQTNPILGWYKGLIFPVSEGPITFNSTSVASSDELCSLFQGNKISPQELKKAAVRDLAQLLL
jgi:tyrosyl-tRNA synthetase